MRVISCTWWHPAITLPELLSLAAARDFLAALAGTVCRHPLHGQGYDFAVRELPSHSLKAVARHLGVAGPDRELIRGDQIHEVYQRDPARVPALYDLITMLRRGENERGFSMMLGRLFHAKDKGLLLTVVSDPTGAPAAVCQFVGGELRKRSA